MDNHGPSQNGSFPCERDQGVGDVDFGHPVDVGEDVAQVTGVPLAGSVGRGAVRAAVC